MEQLLTILEIFDQLRGKRTKKEFSFFIVNETKKIVPYDLGVFWTIHGGRIGLREASGNRSLDSQGPFAQDLKDKIKEALQTMHASENQTYYYETASGMSDEKISTFSVLLFLKNRKNEILGGVLFQRLNKPFTDKEKLFFEELQKGYSYSFEVINTEKKERFLWREHLSTRKRWIIAGLIILALFPVRLSVNAPAEIVARKPFAITAPFDGTIESVLIDPATEVKEGDILAEMDATSLQSRSDLARQTLNAARRNLASARRNLLSNPEGRDQIGTLEAEIEKQKIEASYALDLLERKTITAPVDGVAIFSDVNALKGKPVQTGEQIMLLANPKDRELLIRVPADALIPIRKEIPISYYLNIRPLSHYDAEIKTIGYQASQDPDGLLTYKIRAAIPEDIEIARVGLKGNATVYGGWSILTYAILRRPILSLRNWIGI